MNGLSAAQLAPVRTKSPPSDEEAVRAPRTTDRVEARPLVLVVDDDPDAREITAGVLQLAGFDVVTAVDGADALRMINASLDGGAPICAVVLDLLMPDIDGVGFLAARRCDRQLGRLPVVVLSAVADGLDDDSIAAALQKPLNPGALIAAVQDALARGR